MVNAIPADLGKRDEHPTMLPGDEAACFLLQREWANVAVVARFTLDGEPVSKSRARFTKQGSKTHAYTPEKTHAAEEKVGWLFRQAARGHRLDPDATYGVFAIFFAATGQRRDVDNMIKLVLDGLNKIAWPDDDQVVEVSGRKCRVSEGEARTEVVVYRICSAECREAKWREHRKRAAEGTCESCGGPTSKKTYKQCRACRHGQNEVPGKPVPVTGPDMRLGAPPDGPRVPDLAHLPGRRRR